MIRLVTNIGNTTIRMAVFDEDQVLARRHLDRDADDAHVAREMSALGQYKPVEGLLVSVVPHRSDSVEHLMQATLGLQVVRVSAAEVRGMEVRYTPRETLGADRLCAALAARASKGAPVMAVDCGTATTINVVDPAGVFVGGMIAPGLETSLRALHQRTAQLPRLGAHRGEGEEPLDVFGSTTEACIWSGVVHGTRYMVLGARSEAEARFGCPVPLIITGGGAAFLPLAEENIFRDPDLVLRGAILFTRALPQAEAEAKRNEGMRRPLGEANGA